MHCSCSIPTAPLFLLIAVAIKLDSKGPVFFRRLRVGESRAEYFRVFPIISSERCVTMPRRRPSRLAVAADPRITRVGAILRRMRLDELPQLINVLRGEMSLVGPRPERPCFFGKLDNDIPFYGERIHGVLPGITGYAQVNQNSDLTLDDVRVKLYFDHAYAMALGRPGTWLTLDLQIATAHRLRRAARTGNARPAARLPRSSSGPGSSIFRLSGRGPPGPGSPVPTAGVCLDRRSSPARRLARRGRIRDRVHARANSPSIDRVWRRLPTTNE